MEEYLMSTNSLNEGVVGVDKNIPFFEKMLFSSATGIGTFYFMMIQVWLMFFYTDILKIDAAFVGVMFIVVRIFDAVIGPVVGAYIDRHNATRWGKYKPWCVALWMLMVIGGFLTFIPVHFGLTGNTIYATITYFIFSVAITVGNGPGMGLTASMTKRQDDRMTINIIGFIWVMILSIIVQVGSQPIINLLGHGNQGIGFRDFMLISMVVFGLMYILIAKIAKERFILQNESNESFNIKAAIDNFIKNKYAVITIVYIFALNLTTSIGSTVGIYYYKYYFNDANMLALVGAITIIPTLLGSFLSPLITKKFGLKLNLTLAVIVNIIISIAKYFVPATASGKTAFIALSVVGGIFIGFSQPAQGTMLPLAIDYGEWKYNTNSGAFFGSLSGFFQTLATALSGGIVGLTLSLVHYVPDVQQTVTALNGIRFLMSILPAIAFCIGFVILAWDITEDKHKEIVKELQERRKTQTNI